MSKHHRREESWPIWKIALVAVLAGLIGAALVWLALHIGPSADKGPTTAPAGPGEPAKAPAVPLLNVILLFCLLAWTTAAVFAGWLVYKLYMRIPAWRRRQLLGRSK